MYRITKRFSYHSIKDKKPLYLYTTKIINRMKTINVKIEISTPSGQRLLREVEKHPKVTEIEYPLSKEIAGQKNLHTRRIF